MVPVGRTFCRPILFVIPLVINNPASQSSDFVIHSYYYRPNWTKLGPVTLRKAITTREKISYFFHAFDIANQLLNATRLSRHSVRLMNERQSLHHSQSKVVCRTFKLF